MAENDFDVKHVLLVYDVNLWCWNYQALAIQKYAPPEWHVEVMTQHEFQAHKAKPQWMRRWQSILHFSWVDAPMYFGINRLVTVVAHDGLRWRFVSDEEKKPYMIEWSSWAGASPQRNLGNAKLKIPGMDHVICVNPELYQFVSERLNNKRSCYLPAGVDHEIFVSTSPLRAEGPLRIGWCGQPGGRTKGYEWILEPLMARLEGKVEFVVNRHAHQDALSQEEMVEWYNSIDLFLCTSISEGTPVPPLEAMSCGRGVISTPVGDMPQVLTDDCGIIVPGYVNYDTSQTTIKRLEETLLELTTDDARRMGLAARERIEEAYTWEQLAPQWLAAIAP